MKNTHIIKHILEFITVAVGLIAAITLTVGRPVQAASFKSELIKKDTITIGTMGTMSPYSFRKDGKLTGYEVEFARQLAKRSGVKVKIVPTQWDSLVAGVGSGKFDLALNDFTYSADRKKKFNLSKPYAYNHLAIIARKNDDSINKLSDLKGKRFGAGDGSDIAKISKENGATVVPENVSTTVVDSQIRQKRIDGCLYTWEAWKYESHVHKSATKGLKGIKVPASDFKPQKVGALINKNNDKLTKQINKVIEEMKKDGSLTKLSKKYFYTDITKA